MAQSLLLRGAKQVLSLRGPKGVRRGASLNDLGIIEDGAVLIRDGLIAEVGSTRRIENLKDARNAIEIPANGRIVVPGFVDANLSLSLDTTHPAHKVFQKRKSIVDFYDGSLSLLRSCLQHGTLTADVKASAGEFDDCLSLPMLRKLAEIGTNPVFTVRTWRIADTLFQQREEELLATLDTIARKKLARFIEFSGAPDIPLRAQLLSAATNGEIGAKLIWQGGTAEDLQHALQQYRPVSVYCSAPGELSAGEIEVLGAQQTVVVLAVGKQVFEGPVSRAGRDLVEAGAAIALSSGYDSESHASYSMQMSLSLAVFRMGLSVEQAFSAATINAAHAAGRGEQAGSLEVGKRADILLLNVPDYREVPTQFGVNHVDMALRDGNVVLNRTRWKAMHN